MGHSQNSSAWNTHVSESVKRWLSDSSTSYFDLRKELSSFDFGFSYFVRGDFNFFSAKFRSLGRPRIEIPYADEKAPSRTNSHAIVVTFNPDDKVFINLHRIISTFDKIVIVDNSPVFPESLFNDNGINSSDQVTILKNGNHHGLGGAINKGMRQVYSREKNGWLFWFDQDSLIHPEFLSKINTILSAESAELRNSTLFGINYDDGNTPPKKSEKMIIPVDTVITSGSFTRLENLRRAGLYLEELFIDSLDHEYCLRCRRFGMKVRWISEPLMEHSLGRMQLHTLLWKNDVIVTNHAPFRWYYFSRNLIITFIEGFPFSTAWGFRHGYALFKNFIKAMLLEQDKACKSLEFIKGIFAGLWFSIAPPNKSKKAL